MKQGWVWVIFAEAQPAARVTLWVVCTSWPHPPFPSAQQLTGSVPGQEWSWEKRAALGLVKITASGEAEPPPVALLVPILAQGDVSRAGGMAELGTKGSPSSPGDASVPAGTPVRGAPLP